MGWGGVGVGVGVGGGVSSKDVFVIRILNLNYTKDIGSLIITCTYVIVGNPYREQER